jgi:hypothetical protein
MRHIIYPDLAAVRVGDYTIVFDSISSARYFASVSKQMT